MAFDCAARTREGWPVITASAARGTQAWTLPTPVALQEAETLRDSYRRQPNEYYDNRQVPADCQPFIDDATAGDTHVDTAQFGIIHRFHIDTLKANHHRLDDTVIANIRYVLQQAGTPSDDANRLAPVNGIELDEDWMQAYHKRLVLTRGCVTEWPRHDGIIFKTRKLIVCGASCILDSQSVPVIFGTVQRILGSEMNAAGNPKVHILQWLPNPIAIEKILNDYKWPNLAVVRGLSQGYDDHAITATTIWAVRDYLLRIGCRQEHFALILGTIWFDDPDARKTAPTPCLFYTSDAADQ